MRTMFSVCMVLLGSLLILAQEGKAQSVASEFGYLKVAYQKSMDGNMSYAYLQIPKPNSWVLQNVCYWDDMYSATFTMSDPHEFKVFFNSMDNNDSVGVGAARAYGNKKEGVTNYECANWQARPVSPEDANHLNRLHGYVGYNSSYPTVEVELMGLDKVFTSPTETRGHFCKYSGGSCIPYEDSPSGCECYRFYGVSIEE